MRLQHRLSIWLITNLVLLSGSLLMPWVCICFHPYDKPTSGWIFIPIKIVSGTQLLLQYGFSWLSWLWMLSLLVGVSGIFVIGYVIFNILKFSSQKIFIGSRVRSLILVVVMLLFLGEVLSGFNLPLPGFWLFMLGLLSSMILEWRSSIFDSLIAINHQM